LTLSRARGRMSSEPMHSNILAYGVKFPTPRCKVIFDDTPHSPWKIESFFHLSRDTGKGKEITLALKFVVIRPSGAGENYARRELKIFTSSVIETEVLGHIVRVKYFSDGIERKVVLTLTKAKNIQAIYYAA
jgi:hypothetical protein